GQFRPRSALHYSGRGKPVRPRSGEARLLIDYRNSSTPADVDAGLCIIGAGAAGLAIACSFLGTGITVCVVESGGLAGEESAQSLYEGSSIGAVPFDPSISRMRVFGGSCNLWGGGCIPLGELHPREWVPASGWPIGYDQLQPHYAHARDFCGISSQEFVHDSFLTRPRLQPIEFDSGKVVNKIFARSPVLFGQAYRQRLERAPNITVLLHANLLELEAVPTGEAVQQARIGSLDGRRGTVRARHLVLACGGIAHARLLPLSDSVVPRGLGNRYDLVGRYFMDHPRGKLGVIHTDDPGRLARPYDRDIDGGQGTSFPEICLSEDAQRTHRILSGRVRPFAIEGPVPKGIRALRELKSTLQARHIDEDGLLASRLSARKNGEPASGVRIGAAGSDGLARQALRVGLGIGDIARGAVRKLARKPTVDPDHVALVGYFEQVPNPDSRVTLGEERDALGQRKVCVDWRLT